MALGASGRVLASTSNSHVIVASDSHLGAPKANESEFLKFVTEDVPARDPDALILNGDILEFWTRGMTSACLDFNDFTTHLEELDSQGIDVVLTAGNHDRRLIDVGRDDYDAATLDSPWSIANEFHFESGGREFVAVHGDEGDPLQNPTTSELLCLGSDDFGKAIWDFYSAKDDIGSADSKFIGETGTVSVSADEGEWQYVNFQQNYKDAVVVAAPLSYNGQDPAHARVRDVDKDDFEIQVEEWDYEDGSHYYDEDVGYVALNTGVHTLPDGTKVEVGRVKTDENWASVSFSNDFDDTPVVVSATQTHNSGAFTGGSDAVVTRHRNLDPDGFEVRLQEQENKGNHVNEQIGYIAFEKGTGKNNDVPFEAGSVSGVTEDWSTVGFDRSYSNVPLFVASIATFGGSDPCGLRYRDLGTSSVDVFVEEETSADDETNHYNGETVDYLAFEDGARIYASHSTSFENWWDVVADDAWDVWNDVTGNVDVPTGDILVDDPPMMAGLESKGSAGPGTVAKNLLDQFPDKNVVFGHTHVPAKGDRYVNSGAWTSRGGATLSGGSHPENTYVEIVDGDATVYDWSSNGSSVYLD